MCFYISINQQNRMTMKPEIEFETGKIVEYLEKYKEELPKKYKWDIKEDALNKLENLTEEKINSSSAYEKALNIKSVVSKKLNEVRKEKTLFNELSLWIIKDWGGIKSINDKETISEGTEKIINDFLNKVEKNENPNFERIASSSKVGAFLNPHKYVIYDSRVIYSLNWIILSENAGQKFFPIPEGRNSKMAAFDMEVLIRLKNISNYHTEDIELLNNKKYINEKDGEVFIDRKVAYFQFVKLIKQINQQLWKGTDKEQNLYYTEMLLFSIADKEVFREITNKYASFRIC